MLLWRMDANAELKRTIKIELLNRGITQRKLAAEMGVTPSALNNALTGNKALLTSTAVRMLDALNLKLKVVSKTTTEPGGDDARNE